MRATSIGKWANLTIVVDGNVRHWARAFFPDRSGQRERYAYGGGRQRDKDSLQRRGAAFFLAGRKLPVMLSAPPAATVETALPAK